MMVQRALFSIYDISRTPRAIATIPTGGEGSAGAAISADGQILYVAHMTSGDVTAFRIGNDRTPTRLGSWSAGQARSSWHCHRRPSAVGDERPFERCRGVSSSGRRSTSGTVGASTPAGGDGPRGIVVAPDGRPVCRTLRRWRSPRSGCRVPRVAPARSKRSGNRSLRAVMVPRPSHSLATGADSS